MIKESQDVVMPVWLSAVLVTCASESAGANMLMGIIFAVTKMTMSIVSCDVAPKAFCSIKY